MTFFSLLDASGFWGRGCVEKERKIAASTARLENPAAPIDRASRAASGPTAFGAAGPSSPPRAAICRKNAEMAGTGGEDALTVLVRCCKEDVFGTGRPLLHFRPVGGRVCVAQIDVDACEIVPEASSLFTSARHYTSFPAYFTAVKELLHQRSKTSFSPYERCTAHFVGAHGCPAATRGPGGGGARRRLSEARVDAHAATRSARRYVAAATVRLDDVVVLALDVPLGEFCLKRPMSSASAYALVLASFARHPPVVNGAERVALTHGVCNRPRTRLR